MELKDFIAQSLIHIIDGVRIAQEYARDHHAVVNPPQSSAGDHPSSGQEIHFNLAIHATEENRDLKNIALDDIMKGTYKATLHVVSPSSIETAALGADFDADEESVKQTQNKSATTSRLNFSIRLALPTGQPTEIEPEKIKKKIFERSERQ